MNGIDIAIDRGGTFTDVIAFIPGQPDYIFKLLSVDPANYADANIEGIRRVLEHVNKKKTPRNLLLDTSLVRTLKLGTTVATNALLERKGEKCVFVTTKGFKDSLLIGNQSRPHIFDLEIKRPGVIYDTVVEIDERVTLEDFVEDPNQHTTQVDDTDADLVKGISGETVRILQRPDPESLRSVLQVLYDSGYNSIAVGLVHSYTFFDHELLVGKIAKQVGFKHISLSCQLSPMIKYVPRANSSVADAYLTPEIEKYLTSFKAGLQEGLQSVAEKKKSGVKCQFMKSDGGLVESSKFSGLKAILSGPAGGVVGGAKTCYDEKRKIPLIFVDVGGTSTDISRYSGRFEHVLETTTAGIIIQSPQLDINTIAAGGGSRLFYENGLMRVGPESAGAHPGPVCYKKNGFLTITDANLVLGRLVPDFFPKIFGPDENEPLDVESTIREFQKLTDRVNQESGKNKTMYEVAEGFLNVANESMARPIRTLTESKGHILTSHRLVPFGGAGGQCCCFVAFDSLGLDTVLIHKYSSVLSAYGMALADVVDEVQEPSSLVLAAANEAKIEEAFQRLSITTIRNLTEQGVSKDNIVFERYLNLRYKGTESSLMTVADLGSVEDYMNTFTKLHLNEFGFKFDDKDIMIDDIRIRAVGKVYSLKQQLIDDQIETLTEQHRVVHLKQYEQCEFTRNVYFNKKFYKTPIYKLDRLEIGTKISGPAIIVDGTQTNVIPPDSFVILLESHLYVHSLRDKQTASTISDGTASIDPILLSIFGHRFIDIAEQMGHSLQRTAVSTNVKERLDFSCALFDAEANLIASAPHIPVHLGSMSTFVKYQASLWKDKLKPGDVLVGNHPICGTHLPDITVVTPVYHQSKIVFYVASRAHHSDIGSILPGSMPPNSKELWQEGATIYSELLIKDGVFQEEKMTQLLLREPAKYPGCSGTRKLSDNLSDLKAQAAANQKGIGLLAQLIAEFGLPTVVTYMEGIQANAASTVENLLANIKSNTLQSEDYMDDGSTIRLQVTIKNRKATFDFTGTSPEVYGNLNAPKAITYSAIIFCLRCLVNQDIPLNEGFLRPLKIIIPEGCLLAPSSTAAVVAGNVLTSQRITDVIFKAFEGMADSQGCMNNFTFGMGGTTDDKKSYKGGLGYYETIAGGHGAGPSWDGVDAVHTNMTNTKMTDVEVFEKRYPVLLREFSIRKDSGGSGKFKGGDGVIRDIEFRVPMQASILSERRVVSPNGLRGGHNGARGLNLWIRKIYNEHNKLVDTKSINIGGKNSVKVNPGDRIIIMTPGGGGYGKPEERSVTQDNKGLHPSFKHVAYGSVHQRADIQNTN